MTSIFPHASNQRPDSELLQQELQHCRHQLQLGERVVALNPLEYKRKLLVRQIENLLREIHSRKTIVEQLHNIYIDVVDAPAWKLGNLVVNKFIKAILRRENRSAAWAPHHAASIFADFLAWRADFELGHGRPADLGRSVFERAGDDVVRAAVLDEIRQSLKQAEDYIRYLEAVTHSLGTWSHVLLEDISIMYRSRQFGVAWLLSRSRLPGMGALLSSVPPRTAALGHVLKGIDLLEGGANLGREEVAIQPESLQEPLVIQYTVSRPRNPYYTIIPHTLEHHGWEVVFEDSPQRVEALIAERQGRGVIVHMHQLEPYYHDALGSAEETRQSAKALVALARRFKMQGAHLVWTKHNPLPHNRRYEAIDQELIAELLPLIDVVLVLGRNAREAFRRRWLHPNIRVLFHPSYKTVYGERLPQAHARSRLGLPEKAFIFGNLGHIEPYKGLEDIIEAFKRMLVLGEREVYLVIAGGASNAAYTEALCALAGDKVIIRDGVIPDEEINTWMSAFDASVFAFKDVWASGSVVLSLSFGVPVIAPRIGCMPEYVSDENNGLLYRHGQVEDLAAKMQTFAQSEEMAAHYEYMSLAYNRRHSVVNVVRELRKFTGQ